MYARDVSTATARDVIQRSITCHPGLFAEALRAAAKIHADAHSEMIRDGQAKASAYKLCQANHAAAAMVEQGWIDDILADFSVTNCAFLQAVKLQYIPRASWGEIIAR